MCVFAIWNGMLKVINNFVRKRYKVNALVVNVVSEMCIWKEYDVWSLCICIKHSKSMHIRPINWVLLNAVFESSSFFSFVYISFSVQNSLKQASYSHWLIWKSYIIFLFKTSKYRNNFCVFVRILYKMIIIANKSNYKKYEFVLRKNNFFENFSKLEKAACWLSMTDENFSTSIFYRWKPNATWPLYINTYILR